MKLLPDGQLLCPTCQDYAGEDGCKDCKYTGRIDALETISRIRSRSKVLMAVCFIAGVLIGWALP